MTAADELAESLARGSVPAHLRKGLIRWVCHGIVPGGFLWAVLTNDLAGALARGDESLAGLRALVGWLRDEAPAKCWGRSAASWRGLEEAG